MNDINSTLVAAVQSAETRAKIAESIAASAIEDAKQTVEQAQETAQVITEAALTTEIGRTIVDLEREFETWRASHEQLHLTLTVQMSALETKIAELAEKVMSVVIIPPSPEPSLNQAQSLETQEPPQETKIAIIPADVNRDRIEEKSAVPAPRKKIRLI